MKNLIVYYSKYNHTKRYAEFLKTRIGGEMVSIKELKPKMFEGCDNIIFGSSIRRSNILKIKKFLKYYKKIQDKNVFIFVNGFTTMHQQDDFTRQMLIDMNELYDKHIRFYMLPGGFSYKDLTGLDKKLIDLSIRAAEKQGNMDVKSLRDRELDFIYPQNLDKIVEVINELERRSKA